MIGERVMFLLMRQIAQDKYTALPVGNHMDMVQRSTFVLIEFESKLVHISTYARPNAKC